MKLFRNNIIKRKFSTSNESINVLSTDHVNKRKNYSMEILNLKNQQTRLIPIAVMGISAGNGIIAITDPISSSIGFIMITYGSFQLARYYLIENEIIELQKKLLEIEELK